MCVHLLVGASGTVNIVTVGPNVFRYPGVPRKSSRPLPVYRTPLSNRTHAHKCSHFYLCGDCHRHNTQVRTGTITNTTISPILKTRPVAKNSPPSGDQPLNSPTAVNKWLLFANTEPRFQQAAKVIVAMSRWQISVFSVVGSLSEGANNNRSVDKRLHAKLKQNICWN